jgi:putrescine aminotransferase
LRSELSGILHVGPSSSAARLGEVLSALTGHELEVSMLALSGAEAVDSAMKLARAATGRRSFVSCEGGYHGLDSRPGASAARRDGAGR